MNSNHHQLVERLSQLDEEARKERKVLEGEAREQLVQAEDKANQIRQEEEEKTKVLQAELESTEASIQRAETRILAEEGEWQELEALSVTCPVPTLQSLYAKKAEEAKGRIDELKQDMQDAFNKIEELKGSMQQEKMNAEKALQEIDTEPAIVLWMDVAAAVRREIMHWIDAGRYEEAERAARMEEDEVLLKEVHEQINAKRVAVSAAKRMLFQPQALDLPEDAYFLGHKAEVVIATDRRRNECARWAVSPRGQIYPLRRSQRKWTAEGGVRFSPIKELVKMGARQTAMTARPA